MEEATIASLVWFEKSWDQQMASGTKSAPMCHGSLDRLTF